MKYFFAEDNCDGTYGIKMTKEFYNYMYPHFNNLPYFRIAYQLFGLLPQDFYHYVGAHYHAHFKKSDCLENLILMFFKNKADCEALCTELDNRFQRAVDEKMF